MAAPWKSIGRYGTVGIELVLSIAIAWYAGSWLDDRYFGGRGWVTIAFVIGGVYAGFRALYKAAKRLELETARLDEEEKRARREQLDEALMRRKFQEADRDGPP